MTSKIVAGVIGAACLLSVSACDSTYTPGAHHSEAASTGSLLSGTDTGANGNGGISDPSINSNTGGGHRD